MLSNMAKRVTTCPAEWTGFVFLREADKYNGGVLNGLSYRIQQRTGYTAYRYYTRNWVFIICNKIHNIYKAHN